MRYLPPIAVFFFLFASSPAFGQDDSAPAESERRYGKFYNGAFVDVAARGSRALAAGSSLNGWSWDVGLRQALVMHLLDTRLSYSEDYFGAGEGQSGAFTQRSVSVHGAFHPLYMALLLSKFWGYVLAAWYIEAGIGGHYTRESSIDEDDFGLRLSLGSGLDIPLTDPDRGWSLWVNTLYRFTWTDFDFDGGGEINLHHHGLWLGLSLRFNGLLF